jgi:hypothetical protein
MNNQFAQNIEQWKLVDGYDNYEVSSFGRVRNNRTARMIAKTLHHGYYNTRLSKNGITNNHRVHRLVCFAFCENPNEYNICDHIDRNKLNNMFNNLRWCSSSENNRNITIRKDNNTGHNGVSCDNMNWRATWRDNDMKKKSKAFSINKYGDEEAKQMAINIRKEMEALYGYM